MLYFNQFGILNYTYSCYKYELTFVMVAFGKNSAARLCFYKEYFLHLYIAIIESKMNERLKQFLEMENLTPARFAEKLGIQRSGISHLLSGRNKPSFEFIQKMMTAYPGLNYEWLILGKGRPYKSDNSAETITNPATETTLFTDEAFFDTVETSVIEPESQPVKQHFEVNEAPENQKIVRQVHDDTQNKSKKIDRIIVFFSDGTYEEK